MNTLNLIYFINNYTKSDIYSFFAAHANPYTQIPKLTTKKCQLWILCCQIGSGNKHIVL